MSWQDRLAGRVISIEQAAAAVKDGARILVGLPEPSHSFLLLSSEPSFET